jgi:hypothetical protein
VPLILAEQEEWGKGEALHCPKMMRKQKKGKSRSSALPQNDAEAEKG